MTHQTVKSGENAFDGWISLFDGQSLYGWKDESKANWRVKNGTIEVSDGPVGLLRTTTQFDDYILELEYQSPNKTNSGVFVRTSPKPKNPRTDCYEINIAPSTNSFPTGSIVGRIGGKMKTEPDASRWHRLRIVCDGNRIEVSIDGQKTTQYVDRKPLGKGFIGLQHNSGQIAFRNIKLKPLHLKPLFDGESLDGWKSYPELKSQFSVNEKVLTVKDGPGQLETASTYQNFVFQLKVRTNAPKLNSGIFFRCIPGEKMNGYESQIHNGFLNNDRGQPEDCGTGGIFRRKNARRVVANDEEWMIKTIIAEGPHLSTWVNGYQVCDWTDKRKPDRNPRRGYRSQAGTIMIQGHDPTTDISFKDLLIREMSSRRVSKP